MPKTHFASRLQNPVLNLLWGKAKVIHASSTYYFKKGNHIQKLMHQLKYKGKEDLGIELGKLMAKELLKSKTYSNIDWVIPVPLHPAKKRLRGYNQCDSIAYGLAEEMNCDAVLDLVSRSRHSDSQTRKGHYERHVNVLDLFRIKKPERFNQKKLLVIDDVITTGSTMASLVSTINNKTDAQVLVSSLAIAG
jgi:ComF family protein